MDGVNPIPLELMPLVLDWQFVGSRITCDPPVMDTDLDVLVKTQCAVEFGKEAVFLGFKAEGSMAQEEYETGFVSLRLDELNIIATNDEAFFTKFLFATAQAKEKNLMDKRERIALFQLILYGNKAAVEKIET